MKWEKLGLIYKVGNISEWNHNSALQPTPIVLDDRIRVFVGFRDAGGVGRVGFVDLDKANPMKILEVSQSPVLDIGKPGCFDDNGVVPCAVVRVDNELRMYYAGYNLGQHVRMLIFAGLAISHDDGLSFQRYSQVPVMDRTNNETLFRVVHSAVQENNAWKFYYGAGNHFKQGKYKSLPCYDIRLLERGEGMPLNQEGTGILEPEKNEYRIGRPYVLQDQGMYKMFFCAGTEQLTYRLTYAESLDGRTWVRKDEKLGLNLSDTGWDSEMMAYPAVVRVNEQMYLFYNGNNYGYEGFGCARLIE